MPYPTDTDLHTDIHPSLQTPRPFAVVFHNDHTTPFDFVHIVLMRFFEKTPEEAFHLTYHVHISGRGIAGIYPRQIAEAKQALTLETARSEGHHAFTVTLEEA